MTSAAFSSGAQPKLYVAKQELGELNESSKKLLAMFNLKYPIFQAAPGGANLGVAVANAGGRGCVGMSSQTPEEGY